jgi:NADP-dependent 3-hydroxy acid dehydrogenase YdfG
MSNIIHIAGRRWPPDALHGAPGLGPTRSEEQAMSKNVLVTGASSGIGRATALRLAAEGHTVFAAARRTDRLEALAAEATGTIVPVQLDVTDPESVRAAVAAVAEHVPAGLDVLINNAGYALTGPVETLETDAVRAVFETNVVGLFDVTRAFLPQMRENRRGRIVNVSSLLGRMTVPGSGVYGGTKYAVEAMSDALRMEVRAFGIDVVVVEPGFVDTEIDTTGAMIAHDGAIADYAELERDMTAYLAAQGKAGASAEAVAATLAHASTVRDPKPRYVAPAKDAIVLKVLTTLPTRLADRLKLRTVRSS